jgi:methionyl-tRNA synthetase
MAPTAGSFFISTAIPYVNARPHVGFAFEAVLADAIARYRRARGHDVYFLSGSDDNSLKNVAAARDLGISVEALVRINADRFHGLGDALDLSFSDFIRTSSDIRHRRAVAKLWQRCVENGDVYLDDYSGLYCLGCEQFYTSDELIEGLCPEHGVAPEPVTEKNYFFRLSRHRDELLRRLEEGSLRVVPESRQAEVLSFVGRGLRDFSISRSVERAHGWGIRVPGDESQVIYVWFDALTNYIAALNYGTEGNGYHRYWARGDRRVHVIGKGILRFHAVYWPAMLLSAGIELPTEIYVHGYLTAEGRKISKSLGNAVDPDELSRRFGSDALRYYLLGQFRTGEDGHFSIDNLVRAHDADLADQYGNLVGRVAGMIQRFRGGAVPAPIEREPADDALAAAASGLLERVDFDLDAFELDRAVHRVWDFVRRVNRYAVEQAPWSLSKDRRPAAQDRLSTVLYNLADAVRIATAFAGPFIPGAAQRAAGAFGLGTEWWRLTTESTRWGGTRPGVGIELLPPLFPKQLSRAAAGSEEDRLHA